MAKFKIATANKGFHNDDNQVNVAVCENEDGDCFVEISAWHKHSSDDTECYQNQQIDFPNLEMCEAFVDDFSDQSATKFYESFKC